MTIRLGRSNRGAVVEALIGIWVALILLILALLLIIYLLLALFRIPPRQLPTAPGEGYAPYLYESGVSAKTLFPTAPEGMRVRDVPLLVSTNLETWETIMCRVDMNGGIHAPDGTVLQMVGRWDEEAQTWVEFEPVIRRPGTNSVMMFRLAR